MSKYSIQELIQQTKQDDSERGFFELETPRILEVNLNGDVWAKTGSMVSYTGDIKFEREGIMEHGLGKFFKQAFSGEDTSLMSANGTGRLYLAEQGKKVTIINLQNESLTVNGNDLLAFDKNLDWDINMMKKVAGMMAGGIFNVSLEGTGPAAITSHYEPLTLLVRPEEPVITDPNATVAWSGHLEPEFRTDINVKTFFGRGSGESVQMEFKGEGFVIIQPYEEVYYSSSNNS
ncbi:AIM24 family protein [Salibacterium qingdaonense]|uniref:Uncharacterized conserved protein, AIM24 family n=1 Tax=Salibacterium qingdaonense TaxID=266892 RepID=A0A1I4HXQ1_9BACI|nr:AIM24 family protein [Salibacterium qingdaonense]SFL46533.1 Uncharacterized conserved protein, AIM24 family [Salibacterium qingdaonense]